MNEFILKPLYEIIEMTWTGRTTIYLVGPTRYNVSRNIIHEIMNNTRH